MYPPEFLYTKDHEWIQVDESVGTIGITDYAQKELGDVVFVELPKPGDHVTAAESFGTVESVKAVSEIFSPGDRRSDVRQQQAAEQPGTGEHRSPWRRLADPGAALRPQRN